MNTNAEIHGATADWRKAYERFDDETRAFVDRLRDSMRETALEHAPDVDSDRRERLLKEKATLSILWRRASADLLGTPEDPVEGARGLVVEEEIQTEGEPYTHRKMNPAWEASARISGRERKIARELSLWPGFQDDDRDESPLVEQLKED